MFSTKAKELGTDKGSPVDEDFFGPHFYHTYADFYELFLAPWKDHITGVFECGIGSINPHVKSNMGSKGTPGASLRMWRDLFPNATVYGGDIDSDILIQEDRITSFYVDQLDPESVSELSERLPKNLDLIVDDGLHQANAAITLYQGIFKNLREGGIYIIEDAWKNMKAVSMRDELLEWLDANDVAYGTILLSHELHNTQLIVIQKPYLDSVR